MTDRFPYMAPLAGMVFFLLVCCSAAAQTFDFTKEIRFAQYLQEKELYDEAKSVLGHMDTTALSPLQRDTINYTTGWGAYASKQLDSAVHYLLKVSPAFPLFTKSRFFAGYCLAYEAMPAQSQKIVSELVVTDSIDKEMQAFQLAGMALLQKDYDGYQHLRLQFTHSFYAFQQQEQRLDGYHKKLSAYNSKSPLLAGVFSAVLPGAGKFYAGKKLQGIAAFLPVLSLALVSYEAYRKGGAGSARFITFGALFSVFYIGNIWGSVLSVKIKQKEFYREYDNKILFDLHIPLRNRYN